MVFLMDPRKLIPFTALLLSIYNFGLVHGRTPPNYSPSTSDTLHVTFNGDISISPGMSLQPTDAAYIPTLSSGCLDMFEPYIVFMIDVEIIDAGCAYPLLHWYQPDLWVDPQSIDPVLHNLTDNGAAYVGPQPNAGAPHTYVTLLFRQPLDYKFPECFSSILPLSKEARAGFDLHIFMKMAGLSDLVAANYFTSQNPDSRPTSTSLSKPPCGTQYWSANGLKAQKDL